MKFTLTEQQWLTATNSVGYPSTDGMWKWVERPYAEGSHGPLSSRELRRKSRLLLCALSRASSHFWRSPKCRMAVELAEMYADGTRGAKCGMLSVCRELHNEIVEPGRYENDRRKLLDMSVGLPVAYAASLAGHAASARAQTSVSYAMYRDRALVQHLAELRLRHLDVPAVKSRDYVSLLREFFGNPFRPADPWTLRRPATNEEAFDLAIAAYDDSHEDTGELDDARLCVLSDALEEVGCVDSYLLEHLRSRGPHYKGCWALDRVLGR